MNKTTRKNKRQKGGSWYNPWSDDTPEDNTTGSTWYNPFGWGKKTDPYSTDEPAVEPAVEPVAQTSEPVAQTSEPVEPAVPVNPAFGGYLKGGKSKRRTTKQHTKKRTGGNKCKCGCRNCRCSIKNCKCKCADKRFKCICKSSTCGCKRTLKHRKH
jgi:hypothetical protein